MMRKSGRHGSQNIPADRLHQVAAAGDCFAQQLHRDSRFDKAHAAADIDTDRIRNDRVFAGDDAADRHSLAGVCIRHQRDPFLRKGKLCKMRSLLDADRVQCSFLRLPCLDRQMMFFCNNKHDLTTFRVLFCYHHTTFGHSIQIIFSAKSLLRLAFSDDI